MSGKNISRRDFLQRAAVLGGAAMMPSVAMGFDRKSVPSPRKVGANDKVDVALIGIGNRGNEVAKSSRLPGFAMSWHCAMWTWGPSRRRR